jgi:hypothetical protein
MAAFAKSWRRVQGDWPAARIVLAARVVKDTGQRQ